MARRQILPGMQHASSGSLADPQGLDARRHIFSESGEEEELDMAAIALEVGLSSKAPPPVPVLRCATIAAERDDTLIRASYPSPHVYSSPRAYVSPRGYASPRSYIPPPTHRSAQALIDIIARRGPWPDITATIAACNCLYWRSSCIA